MSCNGDHGVLLLTLGQAEVEKGLFLGQASRKPRYCFCSALSWSMDLYWFRSCSLQEINPEMMWGTLIVPRTSCFWFPPNWCKTRAPVRNSSYFVFAKGRVNTPIPVQETQHKCNAMDFGGLWQKGSTWKSWYGSLGAAAVCALLVLSPLCYPAAVALMPPGSLVEQGPFQRVSVPPAMT